MKFLKQKINWFFLVVVSIIAVLTIIECDSSGGGVSPETVNLGTAGNYAILAKTEISTVPASAITGNIGLSPAATTLITGFTLTDATGYATSDQVTGLVYAADMVTPTPENLTAAVSDMEAAYSDAAGRSGSPFLNLGTGLIGGLTLVPGLYTWTDNVLISSDVTISGDANDIWIFQIPGTLTLSTGKSVILGGSAQAGNIFWQTAGTVSIESYSHFEGIILCHTAITFGTSTSMNGRALAQTAVSLDHTTIVEP